MANSLNHASNVNNRIGHKVPSQINLFQLIVPRASRPYETTTAQRAQYETTCAQLIFMHKFSETWRALNNKPN